jgi:hypothetical protein
MPRRKLTIDDRRRAQRLATVLQKQQQATGKSIQDVTDESGVRYETVRSLMHGKSAGPSFFLVADVARALSLPLATLDEGST